MKPILLLLTLILTTAQANLEATYRNNLLINPDNNQPFTGNLDIINNDWGKDAVEFNNDYVDGILHGSEKVYYQSGKLKSLGRFNQGKVDGMVELYYEDGSIQAQVNFDNGIRQGRAVSYYPDGSKQLEQVFNNDVLDGLHRTWYENGKVMKSIPYSKGLVHGMVTTYYESGRVFEEVKYEYGKPKLVKVFNEDGTLADMKGFLDKKVIERFIN